MRLPYIVYLDTPSKITVLSIKCHYLKCILIYFIKKIIFSLCVWVFYLHCVYEPCMCWCPQGPEENHHFPGMSYI